MKNTNFFSQIATILNSANVNITLSKKEGILSVLVDATPKNGGDAVPPLVISGTIAELDEKFFEVYNEEIQKKTSDVIVNIETYKTMLKSAEDAEKKKVEDKLKKKKTTPSTPTKTANVQSTEEDDEHNEFLDEETNDKAEENVKEKAVEVEQPKLF